MNNITVQRSQKLPEQHAKLAGSFGIPREQIITVPSNSELRRVARILNDKKEHKKSVMGLCVRPESQDNFPDPQIVLVWPAPVQMHQSTFERLNSQFQNASPNYLETTKPDWLLAFILLHEIAHYNLNHQKSDDESKMKRQEFEADEWANEQLMARYSEFARPQTDVSSVTKNWGKKHHDK